ncbi:MAG: pyridine nucleotide-disulfide oxidoreductase [bacterium]|nr:pyridine nucleotide-disulfide oxidoreductase [bacterium]
MWGALTRGESDLTAEEGIGYWLGISGLTMMVLLLTYSLRKRMPRLLGGISIRRWFEVHMILGIAGPTAILFHCNFHLGSLNSTVSLLSMLLVAASGIAGRFIYTRIHDGLLGDRATLGELHEKITAQRAALARLPAHSDASGKPLAEFEKFALAPRRNPIVSIWRFLTLAPRSWIARTACRRKLQSETPGKERRAYRAAVNHYVASVRRAAEFSSYAWLFSLWHALHLPLCVLLFAAAAIHVLAVNLY